MSLEHRLPALLQLHLHSRLDTWLQWIGHKNNCKKRQETLINGILPKGPYLPCLRMADRALLAGYHRFEHCGLVHLIPELWWWNSFPWSASRYVQIVWVILSIEKNLQIYSYICHNCSCWWTSINAEISATTLISKLVTSICSRWFRWWL